MTRLLVTPTMILISLAVAGCDALLVSGRKAENVEIAQTVRPVPLDNEGEELPPYVPVSGLSGQITGIGASTTTNLVARAAIEFRRIYPNVAVHATAGQTS